jgi:catechol 2,3-dioxygenase-like lactoylglutathione lyase family enzyme
VPVGGCVPAGCDVPWATMWIVRLVRIDHVQLAMPPDGEDEASGFYEGVLGLRMVAKPEQLAARGGCWFEAGELKVHLGVEEDFRPARKAHPALVVEGLADLKRRLRDAGIVATEATGADALEGWERIYVEDPFGNRIEIMEATPR